MIRRKARRLRQTLADVPIMSNMEPFVTKQTGIMTMGSCFALELHKWLKRNGFNVFHQDAELIWYNTYTILYEFQRAVGAWKQDEDDVWYLGDGRWQDPYRRCVFANSKERLWALIREHDRILGASISAADVVVITLGLTEVWIKPDNHRVICSTPGYQMGGGQDCSFRASDYDDNLRNLEESLWLLKEVNQEAKVVLTVSPVPLFATFREGVDHVVANTASKSILRAVADRIGKQWDSVHYFHSYEMVACEDRNKVYKPDGRHVRPEYVDEIMREFEKVFVR